ncbi:sortase [Candidatus Parcubacteria bacterium]|nr:MAG: sortase [Candidatus Parcubacteria bacterium]
MAALLSFIVSGIGIFAFMASALVALGLDPEPVTAPEAVVTQREETSVVASEENQNEGEETRDPSYLPDGAGQEFRGEEEDQARSAGADSSDMSRSTAPAVSMTAHQSDSLASRTFTSSTLSPQAQAGTQDLNTLGGAPQDSASQQRADRSNDPSGFDGLSQYALPSEIMIPKISVSAPVLNPNSTDATTLDNALLKGAARYPTSARIGENGTMIIFGHSSGRPVVLNPNFKLFNRVSELEPGDEVRVRGGGWEEVYRVVRVKLVEVDGTRIAINAPGKRLVLVTCNSLGAKEERYVVEASFVGRFSRANLPGGVVMSGN